MNNITETPSDSPSFLESHKEQIRKALPWAAGAGAGALGGTLAYRYLRSPTFSASPALRKLQQASGGQVARTLHISQPKSAFGDAVLRFLYDVDKLYYLEDPATRTVEQAAKIKELYKKPFQGAVYHLDPRDVEFVRGTVDLGSVKDKSAYKRFLRAEANKWDEYKLFNKYAPGAMPETQNLKDVLQGMGVHKVPTSAEERSVLLKKLTTHLRTHHKGSGYFLKDVGGVQSAGVFPTEKHDLAHLYNRYMKSELPSQVKGLGNLTDSEWEKQWYGMLDKPHFEGRILESLFEDPSRVIVQRKVPIRKPTDFIGKHLMDPEMRIHVAGGRAIPELSHFRNSVILGAPRRKMVREATQYVQSIIDKLPRKYQHASFGMDILPTKGPQPFQVIESNPGGMSGFLHPHTYPVASLQLPKQITGRWGKSVSGTLATGVAGATGLGTEIVTDNTIDTV